MTTLSIPHEIPFGIDKESKAELKYYLTVDNFEKYLIHKIKTHHNRLKDSSGYRSHISPD